MITAFISYAHVDETLKDEFLAHLSALKRERLIGIWHDRMLNPGVHISNVIDSELNHADLIVLLISPDFIASDYCSQNEMLQAFRRSRQGSVRVVAIILRPCQWTNLQLVDGLVLGDFLALPRDGKPVVQWNNRDTAFDDVVRELRKIISPTPASPIRYEGDVDLVSYSLTERRTTLLQHIALTSPAYIELDSNTYEQALKTLFNIIEFRFIERTQYWCQKRLGCHYEVHRSGIYSLELRCTKDSHLVSDMLVTFSSNDISLLVSRHIYRDQNASELTKRYFLLMREGRLTFEGFRTLPAQWELPRNGWFDHSLGRILFWLYGPRPHRSGKLDLSVMIEDIMATFATSINEALRQT